MIFVLCVPEIASSQSLAFEGKIIFMQNKTKENYNNIFLLDGNNIRLAQLTTDGQNFWPQWSPNGKHIVFASNGRKIHKNREIYLMDSDGGHQIRLTDTGKGNSLDPRWAEDGSRIYFRSAIQGFIQENVIDLQICRLDGITGIRATPKLVGCEDNTVKGVEKDREVKDYEKKLKVLRELAAQKIGFFDIHSSADGKYLILYFKKTGKIELCDATGNTIKELKGNHPGRPVWTKDSRKIAYSDGYPPEQKLVIYDIEKDKYDEIKFGMGPDVGCGGELSWSKDSKYIVYSCGTPFSEKDDSWLYILDLQTKKSVKLIQGNSPDWN
jgi:Tol biopolymer transport system component